MSGVTQGKSPPLRLSFGVRLSIYLLPSTHTEIDHVTRYLRKRDEGRPVGRVWDVLNPSLITYLLWGVGTSPFLPCQCQRRTLPPCHYNDYYTKLVPG